MTIKKYIFSLGVAATLGLAVSCDEKEDVIADVFDKPTTEGLIYAKSDLALGTIYSNLIADLKSKAPIGIVAEVDHKANATNVDIELRETKLVLFGNPALGTPVMQKNQMAGLDLPQKMLVYTDKDDNNVVAYNNVEYLQNRYALGDVATLETMKTALSGIAELASAGTVEVNDADDVEFLEGVITKESSNDFATTYSNIITALDNNENIKIIAELDHQANAQSVGMELRPTSLIVFGNPALGSPLMLNAQTTAIDLPQKVLVYEAEDGRIMISYNDPEFTMARHNIKENDVTIATIKGALDGITDAGANL